MENQKDTKLSRLCEFITDAADDAPGSYLPWGNDSVGGGDSLAREIAEQLEYEFSGDKDAFDNDEIEEYLREMDAPDLDTWAPYYRQRSQIVAQLGGSEQTECEDWLEDIYGAKELFNGCDTFTDCEARIAAAALELAFCEVREWVIDSVLSDFEDAENERIDAILIDYPQITLGNNIYPFTMVRGVQIGTDEMNAHIQQLEESGDTEASAIDDSFGYFVPRWVMARGDEVTWQYIKSEIDEDFAAGSAE